MTRGHALFTERRLGVSSGQSGGRGGGEGVSCLEIWHQGQGWRFEISHPSDRDNHPAGTSELPTTSWNNQRNFSMVSGLKLNILPRFFSSNDLEKSFSWMWCVRSNMLYCRTAKPTLPIKEWNPPTHVSATLTRHLQRCVSADRFTEVVSSDTHVDTFIGFASPSVNNPEEEEGSAG